MAKNDLQTLKELAQVVTRNKVKSIDVLSKKGPESKVYDFYEGILNDSFTSEEEAASHFYNDNPHHPQYRKLKNKLKERLINTAFFIDVNSPKFNTHQKAFYTCQKNLTAIKILLGRNARKPAIEIVNVTLKKSLKFEFSDISLELLRLLRSHYAIHAKNLSLYYKYSDLVEEFEEIVKSEELAIKGYEHTFVIKDHTNNKNKIIIDRCNAYIDQLQQYVDKFSSYKLHLWFYFLILRRETFKSNQKGIIDICEKAIDFLEAKGFISDQFIGSFYYYKLMALVQIRNFHEGQKVAYACLTIFEPHSPRWHNAHLHCFIFEIYAKNYRKGLSIRDKVENSKDLIREYQNRMEAWHLFDAYLYYLALIGKVSIPKNSAISKFRVRKFLNEVPTFSMDKSGRNIPVLIIQILIQIQQRKYDQITDKIEAIEKYNTRYLRKDNNYRSNCFIKMLLQIPKQQFHRVAVERHTKSLLAKLKSMPLDKARQPFEIEIIPYEDLWEMALESIGPGA